jgi:hypothetical protein
MRSWEEDTKWDRIALAGAMVVLVFSVVCMCIGIILL